MNLALRPALLTLCLLLLSSCSMLMQSIDDIRDVSPTSGMSQTFSYELDDVLPVVREELVNAKLVIQEDEEVAPGRQVIYFRTTLMKFDADPGVVGRATLERLPTGTSLRLYTEPLTPTAMAGRGTASYIDQVGNAVHSALRPKVIEDRFEQLKKKRAAGASSGQH